jgi:hypothetical protein
VAHGGGEARHVVAVLPSPGSLTAVPDAAHYAITWRRAVCVDHNPTPLPRQAVNEQLTSALSSRIDIEQAKGAIAERAGLDMDHSFNWLRRHARNRNRHLTEVAAASSTGMWSQSTSILLRVIGRRDAPVGCDGSTWPSRVELAACRFVELLRSLAVRRRDASQSRERCL